MKKKEDMESILCMASVRQKYLTFILISTFKPAINISDIIVV
jgi:hypothetical protein